MKIKQIFTLFILLFAVSVAFGQRSISQVADELFDEKKFVEAIDKYEKAYTKVKSNRAEKNRITFQLGECYRLMGDYTKAISYYKKVAKAKYYTTEPKVYLYLGDCFRFNNDFDEAKYNYDEYLKLAPTDELGKVGKESLARLQQFLANKTRHQITNMEEFNSPENDWMPRFLGEDVNVITLTSSRKGSVGEKHDQWTGRPTSDIYFTQKDQKGKWLPVTSFDDTKKINTEANEGEASFTADGSIIFFSRGDSKEGSSVGVYIYMASRAKPAKKGKRQEGPGEWSEPVRLNLGDTIYNFVHPAVTPDGLTLYFASDMFGSEGDFDLWKATRASISENFGKPVNLGKEINTKGKELFPVYINDSTLYFSSTGHIGLGGLDIYKVTAKNGKWQKPENLGYPMNTSYDEIGMLLLPKESATAMDRGYISSNRPTAYPHDRKNQKKTKTSNINDDIWYFEFPPLSFTLAGAIRDEKSMQLIPGSKIKIVGSDGSVNETTTNKKGKYFFSDTLIKGDVTYKMYVSKIDYFSTVGSISTMGYTVNKDLVQDIRLDPVPKDPVVLPEILYDLAKWDLKEQYQDSLFDLLTVMRNNPSIVIEIRSHTDCRPFPTLTNDTLSQRRAQSVVDYLISRRIEPQRLLAKGYGERIPREIEDNITTVYKGKEYTFKKGTELTCEYIKSLKDKDMQEAAHQLNRRTEFAVLRTDYKSKDGKQQDLTPDIMFNNKTEKVINLVEDEVKPTTAKPTIITNTRGDVPVMMIHSTKGEVDAIVNGSLQTLLVDEKYRDAVAFSWTEAMRFLYERRINKEDFPERDNAFDPDGNILEGSIVILKSVQIGPRKVANVEAVVVKNLTHPIIMNKVGLKDFGDYEFDKQKGVLIFK